MIRSATLSLATLLCISPAFAGNVIVVDKAGGSAFTEIQPAVNAAQDGDAIVVKFGNYLPATIDGKSLSIVGELAGLVTIEGNAAQPIGLQVRNLPLGATLALRNLFVRGASPAQPAFRAEQNQGALRVEICDFTAKNGLSYAAPSGDAAVVKNSADVVFSHCHFFGGIGRSDPGFASYDGGHGGEGIEIRNATVALYACELSGGSGGAGVFGGAGGDGLRILGPEPSVVFAAHDNWFRGGAGGDAIDFFENAPGSGGDGIAHAAGSTVYSLANQFFPGQKGNCISNIPCYGGVPGEAVTGQGQYVALSGPSRRLDPLQGLAIDGFDLPIPVHGQPGDKVTLLVSWQPGFSWNFPWNGVMLLSGPVQRIVLGTLPASFSIPIRESLVNPGQALRLTIQPVFRGMDGSVTLGSAQNLVVFDSAP